MAPRAIVLVSCCVLASSCSWAFVVPPAVAPGDPADPGDCTESRAAPVADVAFSAAMAVTLLAGATTCYADAARMNPDGTAAPGCSAGAFLGLSTAAVVGAVSTVSAIQGFRATGTCRRAKRSVTMR